MPIHCILGRCDAASIQFGPANLRIVSGFTLKALEFNALSNLLWKKKSSERAKAAPKAFKRPMKGPWKVFAPI